MRYPRDCLVPELCICTAHPNNSSLLQKVVLQLRIPLSMMKSTNRLIKVNTTVPMVKWAICMTFLQSTVNTELTDFLEFCRCDSSQTSYVKLQHYCMGITFRCAPQTRRSTCLTVQHTYLWTYSWCGQPRRRPSQAEKGLMSADLCWAPLYEEHYPMDYNLK